MKFTKFKNLSAGDKFIPRSILEISNGSVGTPRIKTNVPIFIKKEMIGNPFYPEGGIVNAISLFDGTLEFYPEEEAVIGMR